MSLVFSRDVLCELQVDLSGLDRTQVQGDINLRKLDTGYASGVFYLSMVIGFVVVVVPAKFLFG